MQQTLFYIPASFLGTPLMALWCVVGLAFIVYSIMKHGSKGEVWSFIPIFLMGICVIYFVLPGLHVEGVDPQDPTGPFISKGLAIRGYGVFMLSAVLSGVLLVLWRCRAVGVRVEPIYSLAFWMVICGMIGARLFFVIQHRDRFFNSGQSLFEIVSSMLNMTQGGLVVYGSMIGALLAAFTFFWITKTPVWRTADLMVPGMAIGLAIGRIGCLMNGCCWGGVCGTELPAIEFPAGSPPYMQHLDSGQLIGIVADPNYQNPQRPYQLAVESVRPGIAEELGVRAGDKIEINSLDGLRIRHLLNKDPELAKEVVFVVNSDRQGEMPVPLTRLKSSSLPVHPTQIYSAINAGFLCLLLWFYWYFRKADGEVFSLMLILYPIGRFVIEMIRNDELGQFGTELTISQWISVITVVVGIALFAYLRMFRSIGESEVPSQLSSDVA
jgi:phosphatidylglycerol:prolipoprotein diacylglycerol transferase